MSDAATIIPEATPHPWEVVPQGWFSRHHDLVRNGEVVATLHMAMMREACEFAIGGHDFAIRRKSLWKDGFQLTTGDDVLCDVGRTFWSRRFEIAAAGQQWRLGPAGWFTRTYQLLAGETSVGEIKPAGWFTRRYLASFHDDVPPPIQVLAIFLVLIANRREQQSAGAGT